VEVSGGASAVLADADRRAAELFFRRALLAERTAGIVAAEERDPVGVRPAARRRLAALALGETEERFQIRQGPRGNGSRIVDPQAIAFDDFAGPYEIPDSAPVEDIRLKPGLVDAEPHALGRGSGSAGDGRSGGCDVGGALARGGCPRDDPFPTRRLAADELARLVPRRKIHRLFAVRAAETGLHGRDPVELDGEIPRAIRTEKVVALVRVSQNETYS